MPFQPETQALPAITASCLLSHVVCSFGLSSSSSDRRSTRWRLSLFGILFWSLAPRASTTSSEARVLAAAFDMPQAIPYTLLASFCFVCYMLLVLLVHPIILSVLRCDFDSSRCLVPLLGEVGDEDTEFQAELLQLSYGALTWHGMFTSEINTILRFIRRPRFLPHDVFSKTSPNRPFLRALPP